MKRALPFFFAAFVFLCFGLAGFLLAGGSSNYFFIHLTLACICLAIGFLFSGTGVFAGCFRSGTSIGIRFKRVGFLLSCTIVAIGINYIAARSTWRIDTTEDNVFSLSAESIAIVSQLREPVQLIAVSAVKPQERYRRKELLARFQEARPDLISTEIFDPVIAPERADTLRLRSGDELLVRFAGGDSVSLSAAQEEEITHALTKRISGAERAVYFLVGHGEPDIESGEPEGLQRLKELLGRDQVVAKSLLLADAGTVPADALSIAIVDPKEAIPASEIAVIKKFVAAGGDISIFLEPTSTPDLFSFVSSFGIIPVRGVMLDRTQRLFDAPEIGWQITTRAYADHAIVHGLKDTDLSVFLLGLPLIGNPDLERRYQIQPVVRSAGSAWGEVDIEALFQSHPVAAFNEETDMKGPLTVAMTAQVQQKAGGASRVLVYGDSSWLRNQNLAVYANDTLASRSFLWVLDEKPEILARPRSFRRSVVLLSTSAFKNLLLASFLIPECIFLLGLFVWWRRIRPVRARL